MNIINLFKKQHLFLSIKDTYIRIIASGGKNKDITYHNEIKLEHGIIEEGKIVDKERLSTVLRHLIKENKWKGAHISCLVEDSSLNIRKIQIPAELEEEEVESYLKLNNRNSIRLPISNPVIDYTVIDQDEELKNVLVYAFPKDHLDSYVDLFSELKLVPVVADIAPLATYRLADQLEHSLSKEEVLVIHMYTDYITLTAFSRGFPLFIRYNRLAEGRNQWVWNKTNQVLEWIGDPLLKDQLVEQQYTLINRFMDFYQYTVHQDNTTFTKAIVYSDNSMDDEIKSYLENNLSIPVITLDAVMEPFKLPSRYADVLGLTFRTD